MRHLLSFILVCYKVVVIRCVFTTKLRYSYDIVTSPMLCIK